jgi:hypothetical protein
MQEQQKTSQLIREAIQEIRDMSHRQMGIDNLLDNTTIALRDLTNKQEEMERIRADAQDIHVQFRNIAAQVDTLSEKSTITRQSLREEIAVVRTLVEDLKWTRLYKE